jgi:KTSC domain
MISDTKESKMEMKKLNAGKLRAIGYDPRERILRVELEDGTAIDYSNVGSEVWRQLASTGSPWSYYRDNIEEEFAGRPGRVQPKGNSQALRDLFKAPDDDGSS